MDLDSSTLKAGSFLCWVLELEHGMSVVGDLGSTLAD